MDRRMFGSFAFAFLALSTKARAEKMNAGGEGAHRVAIQVDSDDPKTQKLALANARHFASFYKEKNEPFAVEVVAYGPGYTLLEQGASGEADAVAALMREFGSAMTFSACQNTRKAFAKAKGVSPDQIVELPGVTDTPSGIVRLVELQTQGWGYIKP